MDDSIIKVIIDDSVPEGEHLLAYVRTLPFIRVIEDENDNFDTPGNDYSTESVVK